MLDDPPVDLRPSRRYGHFVALAILGAVYAVFAISAWPSSGHGRVSTDLSIFVILFYGFAYAAFAVVTTVIVVVLRPRRVWHVWACVLAGAGSLVLLAVTVPQQF